MSCPDCHHELHTEHYITWRGDERTTYTCKTGDCLLRNVTLTADEWKTKDLESYRRINRASQPNDDLHASEGVEQWVESVDEAQS